MTLSVLGVSPAYAAQVWFGTFNGAYGGATVENIGGPDQEVGKFLVIGSGNVNLYRSGEGGVDCGAGFTSCVSLEASNLTSGTIRTIDSANDLSGSQFRVLSGDAVTLSFELSGNQRSADPVTVDRFAAGLFYDPRVDLDLVTRSGAWAGTIDPRLGSGFMIGGPPIATGTGFQTYRLSIVAPEDMNFAFQIRGGPPGAPMPNDGLGPILRSVSLDVTSATAVPEPTSWALMLAGFGLLGTALRRRAYA